MDGKVTIAALQAMKREGKKSIGLVAWDYQIARIADRAGFDFISVGDSVGVNLWGRDDVLDVTLDEMLVCCKAVRRGTSRALVSCDMPYGPAQQGPDAALAAAVRLVKDGGAGNRSGIGEVEQARAGILEKLGFLDKLGRGLRRGPCFKRVLCAIGNAVFAGGLRRQPELREDRNAFAHQSAHDLRIFGRGIDLDHVGAGEGGREVGRHGLGLDGNLWG